MDGWLTNKIAPRTWQHKKYQDINMWHSYEDVIWRHCWGRPRYSSTIRQSALTAGLTPTDDITALVFNIMKKNSPRKNEIIGMPECSVPRTRCHNTARCLMYILTAKLREGLPGIRSCDSYAVLTLWSNGWFTNCHHGDGWHINLPCSLPLFPHSFVNLKVLLILEISNVDRRFEPSRVISESSCWNDVYWNFEL